MVIAFLWSTAHIPVSSCTGQQFLSWCCRFQVNDVTLRLFSHFHENNSRRSFVCSNVNQGNFHCWATCSLEKCTFYKYNQYRLILVGTDWNNSCLFNRRTKQSLLLNVWKSKLKSLFLKHLHIWVFNLPLLSFYFLLFSTAEHNKLQVLYRRSVCHIIRQENGILWPSVFILW